MLEITKTLAILVLTSEAVLCNPVSKEEGVSSRVWYGTPADITDFPYFAGLAHCGAAIISDTWLLTAAHCLDTESGSSLRNKLLPIWVGGESIMNSIMITNNEAHIHPLYSPIAVVNDIALIKLAKPLEFSNKIQPVKLPEQNASSDATYVFVGRGIEETLSFDMGSSFLKKLKLYTKDMKECLNTTYEYSYTEDEVNEFVKYKTEVNICVVRLDDLPGLCMGDSGSPVVADNTIYGIASHLGGDDCNNSRTIYLTNVPNFVPWIKRVTGL